ncbi:MAG TPA: MFS transporter [Thermomicrobiales bacterium]|nr:MFS transporter [Thermomicrobiales bacterium]
MTKQPPPEPPRRKRSRLPRGLAAFKHRNYRLFYFGQLISVTGTWMQTLAQSWLVLSLTSSAFLLGLVSVFQFAPMLVLGLFAGLVADRAPKRRLLVCTQAISAVLAGTLAILTFTDTIQLWQIYLLGFLLGVNNAFDMPTRQAFVVEMVGKDDLPNAIALNSSLFNAARIVGPAVAGALLAAFGPAVCFAINSVSYIAVISGLLMMQVAPLARAQVTQRRLEQIREGLRYVRRTPEILRPVVLVGFVATFGMNTNIWVPLLAKNDLDGGASGFGLLMSAMGVGSLIGALGLAFLVTSVKRWMLFTTAAALGVGNLILALVGAIPLAIPVAMLVLAGIGLVSTTTMAMANTTVQTAAPDEMRGRIMSVYTTVFTGTAPFGALIASAIANRFGTPISIMVGGTVTLLAVIGVLLTGGAKLAVREHLHLPTRRRA